MKKNAKILIVGHDDAVENSLDQYFRANDFEHVFSTSKLALNTTLQASVYQFFQENRPEYVFLGSVRSGGIEANQKYAAEFIYENSVSQSNILYAAHKFGTKKLLYYGSSCVYPKVAQQPMNEDLILTGEMEKTSEPYALAKASGLRMVQAFRRQYGLNAIAMIPATIYGPHADTDLERAHVLGALIGKFSEAKKQGKTSVDVWGSGKPRREFIYEDDFVEASLFLMKKYDKEEIINVGVGEDISIKDLANTIKRMVGYPGEIHFDASKPDGTKQKLLDSTRINNLGFYPQTKFENGIRKTVDAFRANQQKKETQ